MKKMVVCDTRILSRRNRQRGSCVKANIGADLLQRIARDRDRSAFNEFYEQYKVPAYNLAYQITHNTDTAHEAVQESMLRVWMSADHFQPSGNAQGWVLKIVARESIRIGRRASAEQGRIKRKSMEDPNNSSRPREAIAEEDNLVALRKGLETLPDLSRRLLALYFGAELSQRQIAQMVSISQRSVSNKIDEALTLLRAALTRQGVAALLPASENSLLREALLSGLDIPDGIMANVYQEIDGPPAMDSTPAATTRMSTGIAAPLLLSAFVASGIGGYYLMQDPISVKASAHPPDTRLTAAPLLPPTKKASRHRIWTFEKGLPSDIRIMDLKGKPIGLWKGPQNQNQPAALLCPQPTLLEFPLKADQAPLRIDIEGSPLSPESVGLNPVWIRQGMIQPLTYKFHKVNFPVRKVKMFRLRYRIFMHGRYTQVYLNDRLVKFIQHQRDFPGTPVCLGLKFLAMYRIEIQEIAESALPKAFQHPTRAFEALEAPIHSFWATKFPQN